jgi:hypothetical protein
MSRNLRCLRAPATTRYFDIAPIFTPIYVKLRFKIAGSNQPEDDVIADAAAANTLLEEL